MRSKKYFFLMVLFCLSGELFSQNEPKNYPVQMEKKFQTADYMVNYLLYLPENFEAYPHWPLMIFLHGSGERGDDLDLVKKHGPPKLAEEMKLPFIIVSPQCPAGSRWEPKPLIELIDHILAEFPVNRQKIFLTGLSMGGYGTWDLAAAFPGYFAAIVPICGVGNPADACNLKNIPTWVFHGEKDEIVSVQKSLEMIEAIQNCNGNVHFTIYPDAGHDSWTKTYANPKLYEWLLNQNKMN
jgi:predicted peptidase